MGDAQDRFIQTADAVGGKGNETIAVLQTAKEHRDQLVASDILFGVLLQVGIRFVQKNQGILLVGGLKDILKSSFHCSLTKAQLSGSDLRSQMRMWKMIP